MTGGDWKTRAELLSMPEDSGTTAACGARWSEAGADLMGRMEMYPMDRGEQDVGGSLRGSEA